MLDINALINKVASADEYYQSVKLKESSAIEGMQQVLEEETQYNYDQKRRLINIHKASNKDINYIYSDGRLNSMIRPEGTTNYLYGCGDLPINTTVGSESIDYTYDGELLTNMHYSGILNQSISYTYNNDFLISSMAYADGEESVLYDCKPPLKLYGSVINSVSTPTCS